VLAAGMTGTMLLAKPLGLIPAGTIGVLVYAAGLFVLRIVDRGELRALTGRGGDVPDFFKTPAAS
jgi:hypothetical protein